jgi:hypothetical protein
VLNYLSTNFWCLVDVELSIEVSWCDDWRQLANTQLFYFCGWMVCNWSSKRTVWSMHASKAFDFQRPEYLITLYYAPFANWSEMLPLLKEWVAKSAEFNPIAVHAVFNSLRNSLYVIFGMSCSFSDPFKDVNMIGKFARLLSDCSEAFHRMFLTRFWSSVYADISVDEADKSIMKTNDAPFHYLQVPNPGGVDPHPFFHSKIHDDNKTLTLPI